MKKHPVCTLFFVLALLLFTGLIYAGAAGTQSGTGKVIAIDPQGQGIVIDVGTGKSAMTVGAVVNADTTLIIKGKNVPLSDLRKDIRMGDRVTLKYTKTDDLYAKEIIKK
jgi:uncharacterized protein involved in tellurium resistance